MQNKNVNILGFNFFNRNFKDFLTLIKNRINQKQNTFVVTANPEIIVHALNNKQYAQQIRQADYLVPDGIGIVKGAKILNNDIPERITGYDILLELLNWGNENHKSAFFIGARPEVMNDVKKVINSQYPNLNAAGFHNGYFNDDQTIADEIAQKQPDMVFVALGFPKQETFITTHRNCSKGLWIGLGGSFDVLSGHVMRAPKFWINHHLEWLYRLIKEPSRFIRMLSLPKFVWLVYKQKRHQK
jgi:N-acetylglucosaminyldiphosphoundecaprenol N-acetyl-beta-D-mannosaminyltransferase